MTLENKVQTYGFSLPRCWSFSSGRILSHDTTRQAQRRSRSLASFMHTQNPRELQQRFSCLLCSFLDEVRVYFLEECDILIPQCSRMTSTPSPKIQATISEDALRKDVSIDDAK